MAAAAVAIGAVGATGGAGLGGSTAGESVSVRGKSEGKQSAKKGDRDGAWKKMGMKVRKQIRKQDPECLTASHGQVREFLLRTPCTYLDRELLVLDDAEGNAAVLSLAWVGFRTSGDRSRFDSVIDVQGSGDIYPLGAALLGMADIVFTGYNYDAEPNGKSIAIAEAEAAGGQFEPGFLDALAEVASQLPRP